METISPSSPHMPNSCSGRCQRNRQLECERIWVNDWRAWCKYCENKWHTGCSYWVVRPHGGNGSGSGTIKTQTRAHAMVHSSIKVKLYVSHLYLEQINWPPIIPFLMSIINNNKKLCRYNPHCVPTLLLVWEGIFLVCWWSFYMSPNSKLHLSYIFKMCLSVAGKGREGAVLSKHYVSNSPKMFRYPKACSMQSPADRWMKIDP